MSEISSIVVTSEEAEQVAGAARPMPPAQSPRWAPSVQQVAAWSVIAGIFIVGLAPKLDTDLWWHLAAGRYILDHGHIPTRDFWSFTSHGQSWLDHEWLMQVVMDALYRIAGFWGPFVLFAAVTAAAFTFVHREMVARGIHPTVGLFFVMAAVFASDASLGARPQSVSLLFVAVFVALLRYYGRTGSRRVLIAFPLLTVLWANLHASFPAGIGVIALWLAGSWLDRVAYVSLPPSPLLPSGREEEGEKEKDLKHLLLSLIACVVAGVLTPNGVNELLYALKAGGTSTYVLRFVNEWQPISFSMIQMRVFEVMLFLLIVSVMLRRTRTSFVDVLFVVAFTFLAFSAMRNVPLWAIVVTPLLAQYAGDAVRAVRGSSNERQRVPASTPRVISRTAGRVNIAVLVLVALLYLVETSHYVNAQALKKDESQHFPAGAVRFMQQHHLPPHVLASYAWGGYVIWKLFPRYEDFIDGRADTLYTNSVFRDYLIAWNAEPGWQRVLRRYAVQDVLVEPWAPIAGALRHSLTWRVVYQDSLSVLITRA